MWVKRGICSADSLINIALCCLGYLPGLIHAWYCWPEEPSFPSNRSNRYIILQYPDPYDYEALHGDQQGGEGSVTYYYVTRGPAPPRQGGGQAQGQTTYGTVGSQPSAGQFPGQQSGTANAFPQPQAKPQAQNVQAQMGVPGHEAGSEGSSQQPNGPPPTYADVIKGDHKVQTP